MPHELGCSGRTAHRQLRAWEEAGIWDRLHTDLLRLLRRAGKLDTDVAVVGGVMVRAFGGGEDTGLGPVDRRKPGTKHTLMVTPQGVPLAAHTAGANASDHTQIIPLVLDFPPGWGEACPAEGVARRGVRRPGVRPRGDPGAARWLGIEPKIAKRGDAHGSGLGKVRWVVERTIG